MKPSAWLLLAIVVAVLAITLTLGPRLRGEHDPRHHTGSRGIVLYNAPNCPECEAIVARLRARGVTTWQSVDAGSPEGYRALQSLGQHQVPVVVIGQRVIGGLHPAALDAALDAAGYTLVPHPPTEGSPP